MGYWFPIIKQWTFCFTLDKVVLELYFCLLYKFFTTRISFQHKFSFEKCTEWAKLDKQLNTVVHHTKITVVHNNVTREDENKSLWKQFS